MIAIAILGIGMLMVAATFPVGLDQSRIVTEQTIAPLVANDAFERLRLLLEEPDSVKRIGATWPQDPAPTLSFRQSLNLIASGDNTLGINLPNAPANPVIPINELLRSPYRPSDGLYGAATGFYPSISGQVEPIIDGNTIVSPWKIPLGSSAAGPQIPAEPPYTWSTVFRRLPNNYVQFFVFVNRRGSTWPRDWPVSGVTDQTWRDNPSAVVQLPLRGSSNYDASAFSEGGYLLGGNGGIFQIKSIDVVANTLTLDRNPGGVDGFWFIPADPATGRSPCIGVYSRSFPM